MAIHLSDQLGRTLSLATAPKRIVCLNPSQTETLVALGLEEFVVGVTKFCIAPKHLRKTKTIVGGTKQVSFEKIAALKPDIILCNKEENTEEMVLELEKKYPVHITNVVTLVDALGMIQQYGMLFDCAKKATQLCDAIVKGKLEFQKRIAACKPQRVAYLIWKEPWMAVGANTFINHMLELSGFINAVAHQERYPVLNLETLKALQLDALLLSTEPYPFNEKHLTEMQRLLPNTQIRLVDGQFFSWYGSRLVNAFAYLESLRLSF